MLAQNVKALLAHKDGPNNQSELFRKSKVAQATIGRILGAHGENARIETVERIARAYGLEAWQLLVPGMDPSNPPVLRSRSKQEEELYKRLRSTAEELARIGR